MTTKAAETPYLSNGWHEDPPLLQDELNEPSQPLETEEVPLSIPFSEVNSGEVIDQHCAPCEAPGHCLFCRLRSFETIITISQPDNDGGTVSVTLHTNCECSAEEWRTMCVPSGEPTEETTRESEVECSDSVKIQFKRRQDSLVCGWIIQASENAGHVSEDAENSDAEYSDASDVQELVADENMTPITALLKDEAEVRTLNSEELAQQVTESQRFQLEVDLEAYHARLSEGLRWHIRNASRMICHDKARLAKHKRECISGIQHHIEAVKEFQRAKMSSPTTGPNLEANTEESES